MNLGKISKKLGELLSGASKVTKKVSLDLQQDTECCEISSSTSKAMRSYGLSSVVFKK